MAFTGGDALVPVVRASEEDAHRSLSLLQVTAETPHGKLEPARTAQHGATDAPAAVTPEGDAPLPAVGSPEAQQRILAALNGAKGVAPMDIPRGTNQLVVVTSNNWTDKTAALEVFERDPAKGGIWRAAPHMSWPVNIGEHGMGWGGGGVITKPELTVNGQIERVGGPLATPDGVLNKQGRPQLDHLGHAKVEGDSETVAGLFRLGFAWGTDRTEGADAVPPAGTTMPYLHLDPFYRVIPKDGAPIRDEQGRLLNGQVIRNVDPAHGSYELYNVSTGNATKGSLSHDAMTRIMADKESEYHLVNVDQKDTNGLALRGKLVQLTNITYGQNGLPIFDTDKLYIYKSVDPTESDPSKRVTTGTMAVSAARDIWRDSDYFFGDQPDIGRRIIGRAANGDAILSTQPDNLYNAPVRIVNRLTGEYERLDPSTGKPVSRGMMDPDKLDFLANNDEHLSHELYKWSIVIRQNTGQHPDWGSAYFVHDERKNVQSGNPSSTEGCTSMSEAHIKQLISQLRPGVMLLQAPLGELETVRRALSP